MNPTSYVTPQVDVCPCVMAGGSWVHEVWVKWDSPHGQSGALQQVDESRAGQKISEIQVGRRINECQAGQYTLKTGRTNKSVKLEIAKE